MSRAVRHVTNLETRDLDRIVERHELHEIECNTVLRMLEPAVSPSVSHDVAAGLVADRQRRWAPQIAGVNVANVEGFARPVGNRIVRPRSEAVLAAVEGPGSSRAFRRHLKPEAGVGDNVDPRGGRQLTRA